MLVPKKNERLHKYLKRSLVGESSVISPELAIVVLSAVLYNGVERETPKQGSTCRIPELYQLHVKKNELLATGTSSPSLPNLNFKSGKVPTEVPAAIFNGRYSNAILMKD